MQIPIKTYQDRLAELYVERKILSSETSAAWRQRQEGMPNWDSYGHDGFCWNQRNLRKIAAEIAFLEKALPLLRRGLSVDTLAEQLASMMETFDADDHRRPASYKLKDVGIYQKIEPKRIY